MIFVASFGLLVSEHFLLQLLFPFLFFFFHLAFEVISIFAVQIFSKFLIVVFSAFEFGEFGVPGFFELFIIHVFLFFFPFSPLDLVLEGLFILVFQYFFFFLFFAFDFCLFFLEFIDLGVQSLDLVVFYLTHFEGLLLIELLALLDFLVYQVLLPLLGEVLDHF